MKINRIITATALGIAALALIYLFATSGKDETAPQTPAKPAVQHPGPLGHDADSAPIPEIKMSQDPASETDIEQPEADEEADAPESEAQDPEEKLVDEFDSLTDKWMDADAPDAKKVEMADIDEFARRFRSLPAARKEECLHRALNLIPDKNIMLLAGVLLDKTEETEYIELVFNDILNRDEECKKPILEEIFKDRTHPCWADTAWILDATGEIPQNAVQE